MALQRGNESHEFGVTSRAPRREHAQVTAAPVLGWECPVWIEHKSEDRLETKALRLMVHGGGVFEGAQRCVASPQHARTSARMATSSASVEVRKGFAGSVIG